MKRALVLVVLAACGDPEVISVADQQACARLQTGPFQDIPVGELRDSSAPLVDYGQVYRLTTTDGFVAFGQSAEDLTGVFLSQDVSLEITNSDGEVVTPSSDTDRSPACTEVAHRIAATMEIGLHYFEIEGGTPPLDLVIVSFGFDRDE